MMLRLPLARRVPRLILFLGLLIGVAACGGEDAPRQGSAGEKPRIALVMKSLANEFFVTMAEGARRHQAEHADEYDLIVNGIKDESDVSQQVALVEQMIASGVDAIVLAPADSRALVPVAKRAQRAGIPVINIDNRFDAEVLSREGVQIPFVGPDNREGARKVGEHLARSLEPGSEVAIIGGIPTAFNAQQRQAGFEEAMRAAGMKIVSVQSGRWEQGPANSIAAAVLREHPNLRAILAANDNMALGAAAAVRQAGKAGSVRVVGFDNIAAAQELLRSAQMHATADQHADQLAVFGIETALEILRGGASPEERRTPVDLVTVSTLDSLSAAKPAR